MWYRYPYLRLIILTLSALLSLQSSDLFTTQDEFLLIVSSYFQHSFCCFFVESISCHCLSSWSVFLYHRDYFLLSSGCLSTVSPIATEWCEGSCIFFCLILSSAMVALQLLRNSLLVLSICRCHILLLTGLPFLTLAALLSSNHRHLYQFLGTLRATRFSTLLTSRLQLGLNSLL